MATPRLRLLLSTFLLSACSNDGLQGDPFDLDAALSSDAGDAGDSGGDASDGSDPDGNVGDGGDGGPACDDTLMLTLRDFTEAHADFENRNAFEKGIVEEDLGADGKPVYAHAGSTSATEGPDEFAQWYRDTPTINETFTHAITFTHDAATDSYVYDNSEFFPLDGKGFGNGPGNAEHNFLFTTEAHTRFTYQGGEEFTFKGDDDLWIFINGKLAIDLGGVHGVQTDTVVLDDRADYLGIEVGMTYQMDIFHAERHTTRSNFRIQTTIDLSCIENVPIF